MVMNMKYKIVCVKERFVEFVNMYPDFLKQVYQEQDNMYKTKQIELIFSNMVNEKENFYIKFNHVNIIPIIMEFISFLIL